MPPKTCDQLLCAIFRVVYFVATGPHQAGRPVTKLAFNPALETFSGQYLSGLKPARLSPLSYRRETARQFWEKSEQLTGLSAREQETTVPPRLASHILDWALVSYPVIAEQPVEFPCL